MHVGGDAKEPTKLEQSNSWFFNLIKIPYFFPLRQTWTTNRDILASRKHFHVVYKYTN